MEEAQEFENFYNSDYSFNVEVPKGMNDNDYRDYTFRLNNSITPDERVKYFNQNIPYAEGSIIAGRKKEESIGDKAWRHIKNAAKVGYNQAVDLAASYGGAYNELITDATNAAIGYFDKDFNAEKASLKATEEFNAIRDKIKADTSDVNWIESGAGSVGLSTFAGVVTKGNPLLLLGFGLQNYRENRETMLRNGASLLEANSRAATGGVAEGLSERFGYNIASKYTGTILRKYAARFGVESAQELWQEIKDQFVLGKYDTRTEEEQAIAAGQSALFGGIGGLVGFGIQDIATRKQRKRVKSVAENAGLTEQEAEQVQLSTLEEDGANYRKEIQEQAKQRILEERSKAYDKFVEQGDAPEIAAEKSQILVPDYEVLTRDLEDIITTGYTQEEKDKLLADFEEAVNEGGEDAGKLLELREMITDMAKEKGLPEDEYAPAAKINSLIGLRTWKVYNENSGMTWEQFLGDKQVADVILREAIGENPVFGLEQYGIKNPTDAQIERAAIMEENGASEEEIRATLQDMGENGKLFSAKIVDGVVDITDDVEEISKLSPELREIEVENKIDSLIGELIDTATEPLQIQLTEDNKWHVINSNIKLNPKNKKLHQVALKVLDKVINNAYKTNESEVDLSHNTNPKTIAHKKSVDKYVYFESPVKIGTKNFMVYLASEQVKNQNPNILDLYNVRVKRNSPNAHLSTSSGNNSNITQENENVKLFSRAPMTEAEIEKEWEATFGNASVEDVKNNVIVNDFEKQTYENKIASGLSEKQAILETNEESIIRDSGRLNTEDTLPQNDNTAFESPVNETPVAANPTYRTPRRMGYSRSQGAYTPISRIIELAKVHTPDTFLHEVSHNFFINYFDAIERIADKNSDYVKQAQAVYDLVGKKNSAEFTDYDWEFIVQSAVKYMHTGEAPSLATKDIFDRAKNWNISIYNDIARENPVSPEMKEFFDSLVSEEQDLTGINELHDRIGDVLRVLNGAKTGKEAAISGKDKQDIDLLLRALNARRPRAGKTLAQEIRQDGGIDIDSELAKTLGYDPKKKNPIFRKGGRFDSIDEIEDYLRDKGIYNFPDAETAEQMAKKEEDIIEIIQNADMTYSQNERYQEDLREAVAQNQAAAQKVLGEIMDREGLKNLNEVEDLLLKARKQMDTRGKDIIAVNKNAIKYIESSMYQAKRDLGRIMKEQNNARYNYQQKLKDVIRGLPISYKNKEKLMGNIARVSNKETFDKVAPQVIETAKKYADMEEKNLYRDMIKTWLSGTYQRGVKNKRFTYEGNKLFDELRGINRLTKEQAEEALLDRIQKTTEDVLTPSELMVRRLLQYKTLGADMSMENIEELALDLGGMIEADIKSRQQFDEMKGLITKKNVEDLANRIETLSPSSKALLVLSIKNGDFYSIMNELGGKEFADKFNMRVPFAEQELYLQKRLNSAIKQGAEIYGVTPNQFIDVVQELSEKKYTITPIDNYGEDQISKMEIMHILLGMRQKDTKDLILHAYEEFDENGVQLTNQIGDLIANLDVKDIQFASMLQREIAKDYDEENKAYIFRNGVDMPHLENYFPRKSRSGEKGEEEIDAYNNLALQIPSFYKMRGKNSVPVFQNVWTTFKTHKADASYAIKVFPKYLELYKVMHNPKIQHLIKTKYGADIMKDVNSMINSMGAKAYNGIYSSMNGLVAKAAGNWIKAKIGINPAIFAKQLISVTNYAENTPIGEYLGNMGYAATHPKEAYNFMQDVAGDFINTRFKLGRQNEVLSRQMATTDDTKKGILKSSTAQSIDDVITLTVRSGDIAPIIYGGYARVKYLMDKEGKTKEQAREIFIDETLRSQQASSAPTTSNFQKQGGVTKLLTAFQNTPFQYARILAEARTMHNRGEISDKQYYKTLLNYMIVQPFLLALAANGFYNLFHDDDKDKDLVSLSDVGLGAATSWLGGVPLISNVAQSAVQVATGEQPYGISIGLIEDINKAFQKARKKEKTNWDYIDVITPFVEIGTGKPLGVLKRYTKKIVD